MTGTDLFESELAAQLHRRAAVAPAGDGWAGVEHRLVRRRRRRQTVRVATGMMVALVVAGVAAKVGTGGGEQQVAVGPESSVDGSAFPRLALGLDGLTAVHVESYDVPAEDSRRWILVLQQPGLGYDGKVLFVQAVPVGVGFGFGEANPEAAKVDIRGTTGYLGHNTSIASTLGWRFPEGSPLQGAFLGGIRMSDEDMVAVARAVSPYDRGRLGWNQEDIPAGLERVGEGSNTPTLGGRFTEVQYQGADGEGIELRLVSGANEASLVNLVLDRALSSGDMAGVMVRGKAGVLATYAQPGEGFSVMWMERPDVRAELTLSGVGADRVAEVIASIEDIDEAAWEELLASTGAVTSPTTVMVDLGSAVREICGARNAWLEAYAADDREGQLRAVRSLVSIRDKPSTPTLALASDLVGVIDRLAAAMVAGDAPTVGLIPEGGACS